MWWPRYESCLWTQSGKFCNILATTQFSYRYNNRRDIWEDSQTAMIFSKCNAYTIQFYFYNNSILNNVNSMFLSRFVSYYRLITLYILFTILMLTYFLIFVVSQLSTIILRATSLVNDLLFHVGFSWNLDAYTLWTLICTLFEISRVKLLCGASFLSTSTTRRWLDYIFFNYM